MNIFVFSTFVQNDFSRSYSCLKLTFYERLVAIIKIMTVVFLPHVLMKTKTNKLAQVSAQANHNLCKVFNTIPYCTVSILTF